MNYDWNHPSKETRIANLQFLLGSKIKELADLKGQYYALQKEVEDLRLRATSPVSSPVTPPVQYDDGEECMFEDYAEYYEQLPWNECSPDPEAEHGFDRDASNSSGRYVCTCESYEDSDFDDPYDDSAYSDRYDEFITLGMTDYNELVKRFATGRISSIHDLIVEVQQKLREYNT